MGKVIALAGLACGQGGLASRLASTGVKAMAVLDNGPGAANGAGPGAAENRFLHRAMLALVLIAMVGFAMFSLAGATDITQMPLLTHVHAVTMGAWLILVAVQSQLGSHGPIALHRQLGRFGVLLAAFVVISGLMTSYHTIAIGRLPPFFTPGYFLTLGVLNIVMFAGFVSAAIVTRKTTSWHRRLMLASLIMLFEPVLGRVLPFFIIPFVGGPEAAMPVLMENRDALELLRLVVHSGIVGVVMLGDRLATGRFHPVWGYVLVAVIALYGLVNTVSGLPMVAEFAGGIAPAGQ